MAARKRAKVATAATDASVEAAEVAANTAQIAEASAPAVTVAEVVAGDAAAGDAGAGASASAASTEAPAKAGGFPATYRLQNNTRMPLSLPLVDVLVGPSESATFEARSEAQLAALNTELETLAALNGFPTDAFRVTPE